MKLIEALKKTKELERKADELVGMAKEHSAISSMETPRYGDQKKKVAEWVQAHSDVLKEILRLRVAIQKTNIQTDVTIDLGGKSVTKTIAEWIHRRRDLAAKEKFMWDQLTDRGIKEGVAQGPGGGNIEIKLIRCYDPEQRDNKRALFFEEPGRIDSKLEVINAVTDLIE